MVVQGTGGTTTGTDVIDISTPEGVPVLGQIARMTLPRPTAAWGTITWHALRGASTLPHPFPEVAPESPGDLRLPSANPPDWAASQKVAFVEFDLVAFQ